MADPARPGTGALDSGTRLAADAPRGGPGAGLPRRRPRTSGGDGPWPVMDLPLLEKVLDGLRDLEIPQH
jgi:hypothetical protein